MWPLQTGIMTACLSRLLLAAVNALQPIRGGHGP